MCAIPECDKQIVYKKGDKNGKITISALRIILSLAIDHFIKFFRKTECRE
jgi:hypothetical protein